MSKPSTLWHYTDSAGLYGIVTTNTLRLTDARFLNDRTEISYGREVIAAEVSKTDWSEFGELPALLRMARQQFEADERAATRYLCSLSEAADSLSQWQRYGADGMGYCLGFDVVRLSRHLNVAGHDIDLRRMLYDRTAQASEVRKRISAACVDSITSALPDFTVAVELGDLAIELKNPHFSDEREWRLTFATLNDATHDQICFGVRGGYVKPYVEATTSHSRPGQRLLPLVSVICGPRLSPDVAIASTSEFLAKYGYTEVKVAASDLISSWR